VEVTSSTLNAKTPRESESSPEVESQPDEDAILDVYGFALRFLLSMATVSRVATKITGRKTIG